MRTRKPDFDIILFYILPRSDSLLHERGAKAARTHESPDSARYISIIAKRGAKHRLRKNAFHGQPAEAAKRLGGKNLLLRPGRDATRHRQPQVVEGLTREHAPASRAAKKTYVKKKRLNHVFERVALLV